MVPISNSQKKLAERTIIVMRIRQARTEKEVRQAHEIERKCYAPSAAASLEAFLRRWRALPEYFLVAERSGEDGAEQLPGRSGEIAGVTNGVRTDLEDLADEGLKGPGQPDRSGRYFCILTVAVDPAYRERGIGSALVREIVKQAGRDATTAVLLMCEKELVPFYTRLGFRYVKQSASNHAGITWHEMRIDLK